VSQLLIIFPDTLSLFTNFVRYFCLVPRFVLEEIASSRSLVISALPRHHLTFTSSRPFWWRLFYRLRRGICRFRIISSPGQNDHRHNLVLSRLQRYVSTKPDGFPILRKSDGWTDGRTDGQSQGATLNAAA